MNRRTVFYSSYLERPMRPKQTKTSAFHSFFLSLFIPPNKFSVHNWFTTKIIYPLIHSDVSSPCVQFSFREKDFSRTEEEKDLFPRSLFLSFQRAIAPPNAVEALVSSLARGKRKLFPTADIPEMLRQNFPSFLSRVTEEKEKEKRERGRTDPWQKAFRRFVLFPTLDPL